MASKRRTILDYIVSTTLGLPNGSGNYINTIATKERGIREIDSLPESGFPAVFLARASEPRDNITHVAFRGVIRAVLVGVVKSSTGLTGMMGALDDLISDVTIAFETDRTLGGNCHSLEIKSVDTDDGDSMPYASFVMTVDIMYAKTGSTP